MAIAINGSGTITGITAGGLPDATITSAELASNAVTQAKLETLVIPVGVGQTWQAVTGSRAAGTTYTNSTGRPIAVSIASLPAGGNATATLTVGGVVIASTQQTTSIGYGPTIFAVIPNSTTYVLALTNFTLNTWNELR
jgi:hypothetical protein